MAKKGKGLGWWAFAVGLVLAVIFGYSGNVGLSWLLVLLGLVVGFLNISEKEATTFLIASNPAKNVPSKYPKGIMLRPILKLDNG